MELQQLKNLGDLYDPTESRDPVKVMDAHGQLWPVLSMTWSTTHQCFVICYDDDDYEGPEDAV